MDEQQNALTYKRETLIAVLNERLKETQDKREEQRQKELEKRQTVIDAITKALENPQFVLAIASSLKYHLGSRFDPALPETFEAAVAESWPGEAEGKHDPDAQVKRLIRVYEKAEDVEIKVTVRDEVYLYL